MKKQIEAWKAVVDKTVEIESAKHSIPLIPLFILTFYIFLAVGLYQDLTSLKNTLL